VLDQARPTVYLRRKRTAFIMGKLIRLELYSKAIHPDPIPCLTRSPDFKSYKGHHVLLFGDAYFTSIIGPNGSGKSNASVIRLLATTRKN
jgi:hypothetical protein